MRYTKAHMSKTPNPTQTTPPGSAEPSSVVPQAKRYDEPFKRQAVENWI